MKERRKKRAGRSLAEGVFPLDHGRSHDAGCLFLHPNPKVEQIRSAPLNSLRGRRGKSSPRFYCSASLALAISAKNLMTGAFTENRA